MNKDNNKMQYAERIQRATALIKQLIIKNKGSFISYYKLLDVLQSELGLGEGFLNKQIKKFIDMEMIQYINEEKIIKCL